MLHRAAQCIAGPGERRLHPKVTNDELSCCCLNSPLSSLAIPTDGATKRAAGGWWVGGPVLRGLFGAFLLLAYHYETAGCSA